MKNEKNKIDDERWRRIEKNVEKKRIGGEGWIGKGRKGRKNGERRDKKSEIDDHG